jgi:hypothetical protein
VDMVFLELMLFFGQVNDDDAVRSRGSILCKSWSPRP